jgi:hypothetical protein
MATKLTAMSVRRLSTRSAKTPPSGARNMDGANMKVITRPSCSGEPPSWRTSHGSETDCIQLPMRLPTCPNQ